MINIVLWRNAPAPLGANAHDAKAGTHSDLAFVSSNAGQSYDGNCKQLNISTVYSVHHILQYIGRISLFRLITELNAKVIRALCFIEVAWIL